MNVGTRETLRYFAETLVGSNSTRVSQSSSI